MDKILLFFILIIFMLIIFITVYLIINAITKDTKSKNIVFIINFLNKIKVYYEIKK